MVIKAMGFILFIFFSTVEGVALISLVLCLYRFKLSECFWPTMFVVLIMDLQSFILREELSLSNFVPLINAFLIALLLTTVLRVPIHWGFFVSLGGYIGYIIIQALVVELSFGLLSIERAHDNLIIGYFIQTISALIAFYLSHFLYARGIGFSFDFEKQRLRWEKQIVIAIIFLSFFLFGFILYKKEVLLDLLVLSVALSFFLFFSFRKEMIR